MGFWGMSRTGKDAQGKLNEIPNWNWDQAKARWDQSNQFKQQGDQNWNWANDYWKNRAANGIGPTSDIRKQGEDIMPGVQDAVNNRKSLLGNYAQQFAQMPKAQDTADAIGGILSEQAGNIQNYYGQTGDEINSQYGDLATRAGNYSTDLKSNIADTFGGAISGWNSALAGMQDRTANTFNSLQGSADTAYGKQQGNLDSWAKQIEMLKPGGEFATARTARAFAPATASAAGRLRRAGVDPNSVQASSIMGGVDADRARAMDDTMAEGTKDYVNAQGVLSSARNSVLGNELGTRIGLGQNANSNLNALGLTQAQGNTSMGLAQGEAFQNELTRDLGLQNQLSGIRNNLVLGNMAGQYTDSQSLADKRANLESLNRNMRNEDLSILGDLTDKQMAEESYGPEALARQFQMGQGYAQAQTGSQDQAGSQLTGMSNADYQRMLQAAASGDSSAQQALRGYQQTLEREAQNAGWGTKLLGGLGMGALNLAVPGLGSSIGGATGLGSFNLGGLKNLWGGGGALQSLPTRANSTGFDLLKQLYGGGR